MNIRNATADDLAQMQAIYAYHVLHGTGSFEYIPPSLEEMNRRFLSNQADGFAWVVAEEGGRILGFGYYGPFRARAAYAKIVEDSVYVREDVRGQGVGKAIVAALLEAATAFGFSQMLSLIGDSENTASIGVHASLGFQHAGTLRKVGSKFDRELDVVIMQKPL
ncbi:GNAT family N-acetyltransferase [Acidocella aminolytica]|jgi:phosphinothricin acetyltransferase|uniref:Acetyltransferase n=1 Tax=Acidocella aminolytica 101 = DSM 11237 TaxID=1120923 RepID=A0A0D6PEK8_9PROT|nr:GNAT family N-acetyltransferase [Acidocella aminolytica]GAN79299.1 acetyltransferase [Acidocella aminolytica 101 = DSM 11237]GBQ39600.1 acetyltransferase [Acidocella aminolytica 101 = DSM 11237]SHE37843.1 phosphinothricin acetyltransferase [Acidocella aminolytica 101 = DSM 11237]